MLLYFILNVYCRFDVGWRGRCCCLEDNVVVVDDIFLLLLTIDVDNGSCWRQVVAVFSFSREALLHSTVASGTFGEGPPLFSFFICCCRHCRFYFVYPDSHFLTPRRLPLFFIVVIRFRRLRWRFPSVNECDFLLCIWHSGHDDLIDMLAVKIWRGGCVDSFARCLEDKLVRRTVISLSAVLRFCLRCLLDAILAAPAASPRSLYPAWVVGGHISAYRLLPHPFGVTDVVVLCCCLFRRQTASLYVGCHIGTPSRFPTISIFGVDCWRPYRCPLPFTVALFWRDRSCCPLSLAFCCCSLMGDLAAPPAG